MCRERKKSNCLYNIQIGHFIINLIKNVFHVFQQRETTKSSRQIEDLNDDVEEQQTEKLVSFLFVDS